MGEWRGRGSLHKNARHCLINPLAAALQGVTVRLSGTNKVAVSNDQGLFVLSDVTTGAAVVEVDGTTVQTTPPYPSVVLKMVVDTNILLSGLLFSLVMGALGGLLPALSAIRLKPLDAVR